MDTWTNWQNNSLVEFSPFHPFPLSILLKTSSGPLSLFRIPIRAYSSFLLIIIPRKSFFIYKNLVCVPFPLDSRSRGGRGVSTQMIPIAGAMLWCNWTGKSLLHVPRITITSLRRNDCQWSDEGNRNCGWLPGGGEEERESYKGFL